MRSQHCICFQLSLLRGQKILFISSTIPSYCSSGQTLPLPYIDCGRKSLSLCNTVNYRHQNWSCGEGTAGHRGLEGKTQHVISASSRATIPPSLSIIPRTHRCPTARLPREGDTGINRRRLEQPRGRAVGPRGCRRAPARGAAWPCAPSPALPKAAEHRAVHRQRLCVKRGNRNKNGRQRKARRRNQQRREAALFCGGEGKGARRR